MASYQVLGLQDREEWLGELENLKYSGLDLHYLPDYCGLFKDRGEARLFIYREGTATIIYPFLLRRVNLIPGLEGKLEQDLYDITSPYGYGGPVANAASDESIWPNFYRNFAHYCDRNKIITEFIRFHPIIGNHRLVQGLVEVERVSSVVCVDLKRSEEEIWSEYERNNRKNIKKAYREGLEVILEESTAHFNDFISIYHHTLVRNRAGEFYYFNDEFYQSVYQKLRGNFLYAHTLLGGRIISTELLLYNDTYIHSFLGGTLEGFYEYRPNNILKHEVIKWAQNKGIHYFILGGGYREGDGIFRYKRSFARGGVRDFYVGKKVHNQEAVSMLENILVLKELRETENYFPGYRR